MSLDNLPAKSRLPRFLLDETSLIQYLPGMRSRNITLLLAVLAKLSASIVGFAQTVEKLTIERVHPLCEDSPCQLRQVEASGDFLYALTTDTATGRSRLLRVQAVNLSQTLMGEGDNIQSFALGSAVGPILIRQTSDRSTITMPGGEVIPLGAPLASGWHSHFFEHSLIHFHRSGAYSVYPQVKQVMAFQSQDGPVWTGLTIGGRLGAVGRASGVLYLANGQGIERVPISLDALPFPSARQWRETNRSTTERSHAIPILSASVVDGTKLALGVSGVPFREGIAVGVLSPPRWSWTRALLLETPRDRLAIRADNPEGFLYPSSISVSADFVLVVDAIVGMVARYRLTK